MILRLLVTFIVGSNQVDMNEVKNDFGVYPKIRAANTLPSEQVMLVRPGDVDIVGMFFGADIKKSGDMIDKDRVVPGDIVAEATEDKHGKYIIFWEAIYQPFNEMDYMPPKIIMNPQNTTVIQYCDKKRYIRGPIHP